MEVTLMENRGVRIAVEGCGHGTMNAIYEAIAEKCGRQGWEGVDLLIIGGDFQSVRNANDLSGMSVPVKYRAIGDFHEYYSGIRTAPYLTIFVGGNHEASNYLWELYYGGWVASNIYYLGAANVIRFGPLRIAALSGIWKGFDYNKTHHERLPYGRGDIKSIYHVREIDVRKLLQIRTQVDIGISHDWPRAVEWSGDHARLFRQKDQFEAESNDGTLGSLAAKLVLDRLRPAYWFSAHLHVKFEAKVKHGQPDGIASASSQPLSRSRDEPIVRPATAPQGNSSAETGTSGITPLKNAEEIDLDLEDEEDVQGKAPTCVDVAGASQPRTSNTSTKDLDQGPDVAERAAEDKEAVSHITVPLTSNIDDIDLGVGEIDDHPEGILPQRVTSVSIPNIGNPQVSAVSEALRALLPASFAAPAQRQAFAHQPIHLLADLPFPIAITNQQTSFLALDKCLPRRQYLELLTIHPIAASSSSSISPPFRLSYDPEWLAITRALASELVLSDPHARNPPSKGSVAYVPHIEEAQQWVEEHIVAKGRLLVPENFEVTAPIYDTEKGIGHAEMPVEYNNNQTIAFCEMLGIENKFFATDAERAERQAREVEVEGPRFIGGRGGRFGGSRGGRGGWGGRSSGGRGRGRGRGRGGRMMT